jgi:hypothetical protein
MMFGLMLIPMERLRLMWSPPYGNNNVMVLDSIRGRVIVLVGGYDEVNCKVVDVCGGNVESLLSLIK